MKRNTIPEVNELEESVKLGMRREALKLARQALKRTNITAKAFNDALDAILIQANKLKRWTRLVEGAYARLPKRDHKGIVEIHAARALLAIKHGLELVENFNRSFDPEMETTLPGNDKKIQQGAEKQFRKLQKVLEKIVPEKRLEQLGIK